MLRTFLAFLLIFGPTSVFAQSVSGPEGPATYVVREIVRDIVAPAVSLRPSEERGVLTQTEIRILPGGPFPGPRAGIVNGKRLIVIPEIFILQLRAHVEASIYASVNEQPYFPEWWLDYALWRSPVFGIVSDGPFYRGDGPQMPLLFAGATIDQANMFISQFERQINGMFSAAIVDIILHELGHHAIDRWYIPGETPASQALKIEEAADRWATNAFEDLTEAYPGAGFLDKRNVMGRLFAIEYIFGLSRWRSGAWVGSGFTHPEYVTRVSSAMTAPDCGLLDAVFSGVCELIGDRLSAMQAQGSSEADYRRRMGDGESFATYRLGMILLARGDRRGGCELMLMAREQRAAHYAGWCFEFSYAGADLPEDTRRQMAVQSYEIGANVGWADSIWGLRRLGAFP